LAVEKLPDSLVAVEKLLSTNAKFGAKNTHFGQKFRRKLNP